MTEAAVGRSALISSKQVASKMHLITPLWPSARRVVALRASEQRTAAELPLRVPLPGTPQRETPAPSVHRRFARRCGIINVTTAPVSAVRSVRRREGSLVAAGAELASAHKGVTLTCGLQLG